MQMDLYAASEAVLAAGFNVNFQYITEMRSHLLSCSITGQKKCGVLLTALLEGMEI